ncbi:MAG TPA: FlgD immunoglobulin-like domain containing protein, partial [bacterium]|nr:FlgD immunoglobulin-like domain containing protein [bacterium]
EYIYANYLRDELLTGTWNGSAWSDTITVDATVPSFVRIEVEDQGTACVYSNPLHIVRQVPAAGVEAPRVAATLGPVRITSAEELTLTGAGYSAAATPTLVIQADEQTPGLGTLEIACGVLGEPSSVTGGGTTSYQFQSGVLTLVGLTGTGSTVSVQWGGTPTGLQTPAGRIDRLALHAGVPNPFGEGTVTELALPRPSSVFLEVLDVTGRRIRLLVDERRDAGIHRVAWDGRDSYGRSVANGVYFFRLTASGEVLTAKAVRLR